MNTVYKKDARKSTPSPFTIGGFCDIIKKYIYIQIWWEFDGSAIMGSENGHKIKLLKLMELFRQETDEQHPMQATVVCEKLAERGVPCDRRTLSRDIKVLNDNGYEVMSTMIGHEKAYYVEDRSFAVPELKVLIDAVQAASFITEKKTAELIDKIADLGGSNRAQILKDNMVCFNTRKHSNESIYYNVGFLEEAIQRQKKVIFYYHDLNENGERVYRHKGHHYVVEPIALVFNEDNYYLVSYSSRHGSTSNYRVDRMSGVEIIDEDITDVAVSLREDVCEYTEQAFKMYRGEPVEVTLQFTEKLIGSVYDKFGEGIKMTRTDGDIITATVKVQIAPTFWGWLFQFGKNMKIVSLASVANSYREQIKELS